MNGAVRARRERAILLTAQPAISGVVATTRTAGRGGPHNSLPGPLQRRGEPARPVHVPAAFRGDRSALVTAASPDMQPRPALDEPTAAESGGSKAERGGFEPPVPLPAHRFSRPARSTTPAPLRRFRRGGSGPGGIGAGRREVGANNTRPPDTPQPRGVRNPPSSPRLVDDRGRAGPRCRPGPGARAGSLGPAVADGRVEVLGGRRGPAPSPLGSMKPRNASLDSRMEFRPRLPAQSSPSPRRSPSPARCPLGCAPEADDVDAVATPSVAADDDHDGHDADGARPRRSTPTTTTPRATTTTGTATRTWAHTAAR